MLADQRDESTWTEALYNAITLDPSHAYERLRFLIRPDWQNHAATHLELRDEGLGDLGSAGCNEDAIVRLICVPSVSAVGRLYDHIANTDDCEPCSGLGS